MAMVKDPVCGMVFDTSQAQSQTTYQEQAYAYCVASKRYALFSLQKSGDVVLRALGDGDDYALRNRAAESDVRKYSEHGLGAYEAPCDPITGRRIEKLERAVWYYLINRALGRPVELPVWSYQPALTQFRISTPEQLRWFEAYNRTERGEEKPYAEAVKPFNFLGHAMPKPRVRLRVLPNVAIASLGGGSVSAFRTYGT
jgi:YHS domain-containing protein